jgi:hypothetical protein
MSETQVFSLVWKRFARTSVQSVLFRLVHKTTIPTPLSGVVVKPQRLDSLISQAIHYSELPASFPGNRESKKHGTAKRSHFESGESGRREIATQDTGSAGSKQGIKQWARSGV